MTVLPSQSGHGCEKVVSFLVDDCVEIVECSSRVLCTGKEGVNSTSQDSYAVRSAAVEGTNFLDLAESESSNAHNVLVYDDCVLQGSVASQGGAQFWKFGADDLSIPVSVKGRLRNNIKFWKDILHAPP